MWLNLRETAWRRCDKLARKMNWDAAFALGTVVLVLRDSQELKKAHATGQEICWWAEVEDQDAQRFLDAMVWAGLLSPVSPGVFEIIGNQEELDRKEEAEQLRQLRAIKGGEANRERWRKIKAGELPDPRSTQSGVEKPNHSEEAPHSTRGAYELDESLGELQAPGRLSLGSLGELEEAWGSLGELNGMEWNGKELNGKEEEKKEGAVTNKNGSAANAARRADDLPNFDAEPFPEADDEVLLDAALMGLESSQTKPKPKVKAKGPVFDLCTPQLLAEAMLNVEQKTQELWLAQYEGHEDWMRRTLMDAYGWVLRNTHKAPKSRWGDFYSRWLKKDFENYRKSLPSTRLSRSDQSALTGLQQLEMVRRGEL